jgi:hypothetical protein
MGGHGHGHGLNGSGTVLERFVTVAVTFSAKNERFTVPWNETKKVQIYSTECHQKQIVFFFRI